MLIDSIENKQKIINNLIKLSEFEGWSNESLKLAFAKSDIDEKYLELIFENQIFSAIEFITNDRCQKLSEFSKNFPDFLNQKISQKISLLLFNFLMLDQANKTALKRLLNFYLNPQNLLDFKNCAFKHNQFAIKQTYLVSDHIWKLCGDNSTDINFFSKRIILSKIIMRSFIFFVNDDSDNSTATKSLIDAQISRVINFSKFKNFSKKRLLILKNKLDEIINDPNNSLKNPQNIFTDLPFIRLIKKNFFK